MEGLMETTMIAQELQYNRTRLVGLQNLGLPDASLLPGRSLSLPLQPHTHQ